MTGSERVEPDGSVASRRIVVTGVSGSGKSTVGRALADRLGLRYADGDDFHSKANVDKMTSGIALVDEDRIPWLRTVGTWICEQDGAVVACSALKRSYRDLIRSECRGTWVVQLSGDPDLIRSRQADRHGHFMPPSLMSSQLATLEPLQPDEPGTVVDVAPPVAAIVEQILAQLRGARGDDH